MLYLRRRMWVVLLDQGDTFLFQPNIGFYKVIVICQLQRLLSKTYSFGSIVRGDWGVGDWGTYLAPSPLCEGWLRSRRDWGTYLVPSPLPPLPSISDAVLASCQSPHPLTWQGRSLHHRNWKYTTHTESGAAHQQLKVKVNNNVNQAAHQ